MEQFIVLRSFLLTLTAAVVLFVAYTMVTTLAPLWWADNTPSDRQILRGAEAYLILSAPDNFRLNSANHVYSVRRGSKENHYGKVEAIFETNVDFYDTGAYRSGLKKATNDPSTKFYLKYPEGTEVTFLRSVFCSATKCSGGGGPRLVARKHLHMLDDLGPRSAVTWIRERYPNATFLDQDGDTVVFTPDPSVESTTPTASSEPGISRSKKAKI